MEAAWLVDLDLPAQRVPIDDVVDGEALAGQIGEQLLVGFGLGVPGDNKTTGEQLAVYLPAHIHVHSFAFQKLTLDVL